ncbi:MAG: NAD(P)/FAD-dependent oxidoreductase [Hyphomicrobiaceae bacterium]
MSERANQHVIVVGAGIIGASIAWHLVRDGARVTVIDQHEPGGVATPCSFGWINSSYGNPKLYFDLRVESMQAWKELVAARPGLPYRQTGSIYLHMDDHDGTSVDLEAFAKTHAGWGYDIGIISGDDLRRRAANVRELPDVALFAPQEAVAEGTETARLLIQDVTAAGGTLVTGTPVERLTTRSERVTGVVTAHGPVEGDEVVGAAGAETPDLVAGIAPAVPLDTPAGILLHTHPVPPLIPHLTLARGLHIRQRGDGSLLAGWDFTGKTGNDTPEVAADQLATRIREVFTHSDDVEIADITVGYRPTPQDGFPVVGRPGNIPGLTVAVMHSGITLAPIVGEAVAAFLRTGKMHAKLAPYGPGRFETGRSGAVG